MRRYTYADLATPSMLFLIANDAANYDVDAIAKLYVDHAIVSSSIDRHALIGQHFEWLLSSLLQTYGAGGIFERLPPSFLPTAAHRFYATMKLSATLDWWQYRLAIDSYNYAVRALVWRSNQIGGVAVEREEVKLDAGLAMFLDTVGPERTVPVSILAQLFADSYDGRVGAFSPVHRKLLRTEAHTAMQRIREAWRAAPGASEDQRKELAAESIFSFASAVSRSNKLLDRICFVYADQFSEFAQERLNASVLNAIAAIDAIPADTYVLVEGPSDVVYLETVLEQANVRAARVRCIDCGGGSKVLSRARALLQEQPDASVITVFDSDAAGLHREAELLFRTKGLCRSFCFESGAVEEQIPIELHVSAILSSYASDLWKSLDERKPLVPQIKRHLWQELKVEFDKVGHAKAVASHMTADGPRSQPLWDIAETAVGFASQKRTRRSTSAAALDRLVLFQL